MATHDADPTPAPGRGHAAGRSDQPSRSGRHGRWAWAAAGLAAWLVLASCGGGSGAGSGAEPAPPASPETTEYSAETSTRLTFGVGPNGSGPGPLRFALASAPEGLLIDAESGLIEWVPQAEQLGPHDVSVLVSDGAGGSRTKSYRINVAAPAGLPPWIVLGTEAAVIAPGQELRASWRIGGEMPADGKLQVRAHAPAVDPAATDTSPTSWWLDGQGAWTGSEAARGAATRAGELRLTMPHAMRGLWVIDMRLIDADERAVALGARRVFVADQPALRLVLNRPVANTLDRVKAELDVAAPPAAGAVRLAAWLVRPDGAVVNLPGLAPGDLEVQRGEPIANGRQRLLDREFEAGEEGDYRLHARLYTADGRLLAEASRRFDICDAPGEVSGVVRRPDGTRLDGTALASATVSAFDLDDRTVTAQGAIEADGRYRLTLPPGRYALMATALDATRLGVQGGNGGLLAVGCAPAAAVQDLQLETR